MSRAPLPPRPEASATRQARTSATGTTSRARSLLRLVRQDKNDPWAVRLLPRIVFALAAAYTLFAIASQSGSSFVMVCAVLLLGGAVWLLRRRTQLLLALASTILATAFTGYFSAVGESARMTTSTAVTGTAAFGYWALAGMALLGAWMVKEHPSTARGHGRDRRCDPGHRLAHRHVRAGGGCADRIPRRVRGARGTRLGCEGRAGQVQQGSAGHRPGTSARLPGNGGQLRLL